MMVSCQRVIIFNEFKVACVCWAGKLRDVGRFHGANIVPVDANKERVALEILNAVSSETNFRLTDQPGSNKLYTIKSIVHVHVHVCARVPLCD